MLRFASPVKPGPGAGSAEGLLIREAVMTELYELSAKKEQQSEIPEDTLHSSKRVESELTKIVDLTLRTLPDDPNRRWSRHVLWLRSID